MHTAGKVLVSTQWTTAVCTPEHRPQQTPPLAGTSFGFPASGPKGDAGLRSEPLHLWAFVSVPLASKSFSIGAPFKEINNRGKQKRGMRPLEYQGHSCRILARIPFSLKCVSQARCHTPCDIAAYMYIFFRPSLKNTYLWYEIWNLPPQTSSDTESLCLVCFN